VDREAKARESLSQVRQVLLVSLQAFDIRSRRYVVDDVGGYDFIEGIHIPLVERLFDDAKNPGFLIFCRHGHSLLF
jgi:hypothetical protein